MKKELSPREEEILELCIDGLTNDAIATRLGLSVGTVKTYWLRIRSKVGGSSRTETVARLIRDRANAAVEASLAEKADLETLLAQRSQDMLRLRSAMALLDMAAKQTQSALWATDTEMQVQFLSQGNGLGKSPMHPGNTVQEIFRSNSAAHPAIDAHLQALAGQECSRNLSGVFRDFRLQVLPLRRADDDASVIGCIGILNQESATAQDGIRRVLTPARPSVLRPEQAVPMSA